MISKLSAGNRFICTLALAGIPAFGSYSINFTPGNQSTAPTPNSSPYNALLSYRFEGRIHNWTSPSTGFNYFVQAAAGNVAIDSAKNLYCISNADSTTREAVVSIAAYSDFLFRCQRDTANSRMLLEVWNYDGTNYVANQQPTAPNPQPVSWGGGLGFGSYSSDPAAILSLAYFRWYSTVLAPQSGPPTNASSNGNLGDWEFELNTRDSSGKGLSITSWSIAAPAYSTTPTYGPSVYLVNPPLTVKAGTSFTVNAASSFSLNDNPTLSFTWQLMQYIPLPGSVATSLVEFRTQNMNTSSAPTLLLPVAGTYYLQLTVTDSNGNTGSRTLTIGSVATDANGVVIVPDGNTSLLLGPLTVWGSSPWPWYDLVEKADADALFAPGGIPSTPPWGSNAAGTISVTNVQTGNAWLTVTGSGTSFTTLSACNGTDSIAIFYQLANGQFGARPYTVMSCPSDTSMVINQWNTGATVGYDASGPQSGLNFALVNNTALQGWISTTTSWNYYDAVLALYRLYYRTGINTYLNYARQLADHWYQFPLDGGRCYNNSGSYQPQGARSASLLGMMVRALDGEPGRWLDSAAAGAPLDQYGNPVAGIKGAVDELFGAYVTSFFSSPPYDPGDFVDPRETGYALKFSIMYAALAPAPGTPSAGGTYNTQNYNAILGSNSLSSRYHPGYGFTTNADPTSASGGSTAYGYSGPNYHGSVWLSMFLHKALIAYIQTQPAYAATTLTLLQNAFNAWFTAHYFGGTCQGITYSSNYASCDVGWMPVNPSNGSPAGTVTFSNGSATVTGTGTAFTTNPPWTDAGLDYIGLPIGYNGGYLNIKINARGISSATSLTLSTNYTQCSTCSTVTSAVQGSWGYAQSCAAPSGVPGAPPNTYSTLASSISQCSPIGYGNAERAVGELVHEVNGFLYQQTGLTQYLAQGDALFAAGYGCGTPTLGCESGGTGLAGNITGGGPGADGGSGNFGDLLTYVVNSQFARSKEFGSNSGAGLADTYLAYRLGGVLPPTIRRFAINFNLAPVRGATQARVTLTQPSGVVTVTNCSASPCSVNVDVRTGTPLMKLDYLTATGALASSGTQIALKAN
jgi:hypothetical protein